MTITVETSAPAAPRRRRSAASTTSSGGSGTPARPPRSSPRRSGSRSSPTPVPRPARRDASPTCSQQGDVRFMVTGGAAPRLRRSPRHVLRHGDGIRDVCFLVDDVDAAYDAALARGARRCPRPPDDDSKATAVVRRAAIATYGDTVHTFLDRAAYDGSFAPEFEPATPSPTGRARGRDHAHRPRRRQRRAGRARRVGRATTSRCSASTSSPTSTTTRSRPSTRRSMSTVVWDDDRGRAADQRAGRRGGARARSRSTSTSTGRPACSTSRCAPPTSSPTVARAARTAASGSWTCPTTYYDEARERLAELDLPWDDAARARHPRRPRPRRLPAADLHRDVDRPADRLLRDHPARGRDRLRRGQLQGPVRVHRARPGPARQPLGRRRAAARPSARLGNAATARWGVGKARAVHEAVGQDQSASFDDVFRLYGGALVRLAYLLTGSEPVAEDLVQEAFTRLARNGGDVPHPEAFLRRSVVNAARSWRWRRRFALYPAASGGGAAGGVVRGKFPRRRPARALDV